MDNSATAFAHDRLTSRVVRALSLSACRRRSAQPHYSPNINTIGIFFHSYHRSSPHDILRPSPNVSFLTISWSSTRLFDLSATFLQNAAKFSNQTKHHNHHRRPIYCSSHKTPISVLKRIFPCSENSKAIAEEISFS